MNPEERIDPNLHPTGPYIADRNTVWLETPSGKRLAMAGTDASMTEYVKDALETYRKPASTSIAAYLVGEINVRDIPHRKGWKPSDFPASKINGAHLQEEVDELLAALDQRITAILHCRGLDDPERQEIDAHAKEELADVFACCLQIAYRLNISFSDLDAEAIRKLRLRFIGADQVQLP